MAVSSDGVIGGGNAADSRHTNDCSLFTRTAIHLTQERGRRWERPLTYSRTLCVVPGTSTTVTDNQIEHRQRNTPFHIVLFRRRHR